MVVLWQQNCHKNSLFTTLADTLYQHHKNQQLAHAWHCWNRSSIIVSALQDTLLFQTRPLIVKMKIDCHHLTRQCCPPTAAGKIDGALAKAANDFCMSGFYKAKHTRTSTNQGQVFCNSRRYKMVKTMYFIHIVRPQNFEYICRHLL